MNLLCYNSWLFCVQFFYAHPCSREIVYLCIFHNVFSCFCCGFVNRAVVCKAISRDWGCYLAYCWVACCMCSFPTAWSLFQFLGTLNSTECLRCSLVFCSESALELWTKLLFNIHFLRPIQFVIYSHCIKKKKALMKCFNKYVWKAFERCRSTLVCFLKSLTCGLINFIQVLRHALWGWKKQLVLALSPTIKIFISYVHSLWQWWGMQDLPW